VSLLEHKLISRMRNALAEHAKDDADRQRHTGYATFALDAARSDELAVTFYSRAAPGRVIAMPRRRGYPERS
jgi:hypothetical protein